MHAPQSALEEVGKRGQLIYEQRLKSILEPEHDGEYILIDVDSGDYELDKDFFAASDRAGARFDRRRLYATRVGFGSLCRIGGRFKVIKQ